LHQPITVTTEVVVQIVHGDEEDIEFASIRFVPVGGRKGHRRQKRAKD
jgi:hypothetical protein